MKRPAITIFLLLFFAAMAIAWYSFSGTGKRIISPHLPKNEKALPLLPNSLLKINRKAIAARSYSIKEGYNSSLCFLIDMSLPSGQ